MCTSERRLFWDEQIAGCETGVGDLYLHLGESTGTALV